MSTNFMKSLLQLEPHYLVDRVRKVIAPDSLEFEALIEQAHRDAAEEKKRNVAGLHKRSVRLAEAQEDLVRLEDPPPSFGV